jgi:hypothetical protein
MAAQDEIGPSGFSVYLTTLVTNIVAYDRIIMNGELWRM